MRWAVLLLVAMTACDDAAPLPITLSVTPLREGLVPPGRPLDFQVDIDFQHDQPMQSVRLYVSGALTDTVFLAERIWADDMHRTVHIDVPLEPISGPVYVYLGARIGDLQLSSDTLVLMVGDDAPPSITLSPPSPRITPGTSFIVGFTATDNSGIVAAEAVFSGAWSARLDLAPRGEVRLHSPFAVIVPPGPIPGEVIDLAIVVRDVSGNADTAHWTFAVVDESPPQATLSASGARFVMPYSPTGSGTFGQLRAFLLNTPMTFQLRVTDAVGLSHVVLHNRLFGATDTIRATGRQFDTTIVLSATTSESRIQWVVLEGHDHGGNAHRDSMPVGVFHARVPTYEVGPGSPFTPRPNFTPDGAEFIDVSGLSNPGVFSLGPLRLVRTIPVPMTSADFSTGGDTLYAYRSGSPQWIVTGPFDGPAESYDTLTTLAAGLFLRRLVVAGDGTLAFTAYSTFPNYRMFTLNPSSGVVQELGPSGSDDRVARPHNRAYVLFGSGTVMGGARSSTTQLPTGDISFDTTGDVILAGSVLYDAAWNARSLWPGAARASALSPDGTRAWLAFLGSPEVVVVRTSDGVVLDRLLLPVLPSSFTLAPSGETLLVSGGGLHAVDVR